MEGAVTVIYAPVSRFLSYLAQGWRLPDPVEAMIGRHGRYSILLWREE